MNQGKITLFYFISFFCISFITNAQDIHFSQYDENAALVNPALVAFDNSIKASVIYRDQWGSVSVPYKTFGAQVELSLKPKNWKKSGEHLTRVFKKTNKWLSCGLSFFSDKAGDANMGLNQVNFALASHIPLTRKSLLSAGIEASIVERTINYSKLVWPDQYNGAGYDPSLNSGENFTVGNYIYPDFAAGILWNYGYGERYISANDNFKVDVGASIFHFNQPKQAFLVDDASDERLAPKYIFHSKLTVGIPNTSFSVIPSGIVQFQGAFAEIIAGTYVRYTFHGDSKYTGNVQSSSISLGAFMRTGDALIIATQFEFKQYAFGYSYDVNYSELRPASTFRGGFEIFIRFVNHSSFLYQNDKK